MNWTKAAIYTVVLAIVGPFLVDHLYPAWLMIVNHPKLLPEISEFEDYKIKFADQIRNCEDVVLDEKRGTAILSCDPGRDKWNTVMGTFIDPSWSGALWYYNYPKFAFHEEGAIHRMEISGMDPEAWMKFHPLGIGYWSSNRTLYVANHSPLGPTIEVFKVNKQVTCVVHERTISHDLLNTPNSIIPISDHEIYITNDHKWEVKEHRQMATLETYLSFPGGSVVYMNLHTNETFKVASLPFANGIAVINGTVLAVASTTTPSVNIYAIDLETKNITRTQKISVPFWVDNLSVDSNGILLIAGHPWAPAVTKVSKTNHLYQLGEGQEEGLPMEQRPKAPSWVAEWDGNAKGELRNLYVGKEYGTSTTAVRDVGRNIGIVVGLYEKGIMLFKSKPRLAKKNGQRGLWPSGKESVFD
ncbi:calcium-dependent phosphotriesterase [Tothia fuscella]|uniref:Calcium-dependent phosphotriesterase n=1 Tax=Tothia fuscella TaxID=1048955 RepID=A0A9P4TVX4_9PEZI|nr:calcium-dependent phosphotriesterase [Tothia fuscella]